jgi:hypothetical protein
MPDMIIFLVIEKLSQTDKQYYEATDHKTRLILADDGETLWIGYQPENAPTDEEVNAAMVEFLKI